MRFNLITEGSKDYMKYVLQLSEAKSKSKSKVKDPNIADPELLIKLNTSKNIRIPTEDQKRPIKAAGSGGTEEFFRNSKPKWDDEFLDTKPYDRTKKNDSLVTPILFGGSNLPNDKGKILKKSANGDDGPEETDESGGLDYLTKVAQGASVIDFADQQLPAAAKLALAAALFDKKVQKTPCQSTGAIGSLGSFQKDLMDYVKKHAGGKNLGPLGDKVFKYTENLGALDPMNPLLGLKLGYEMLGGNEILKRTRELGTAQSSGAQSSMGHPSGFGYYGR